MSLRGRRAGLNTETVVQAAARLADEAGLEGLTLAALAGRLGVRTPSLYNHVGGLEELRHRLAVLGVQELTEALTRAVLGKTGPQAVKDMAQAYRAYIKRRPGVYAAAVRSPLLATDPDGKLTQAADRLMEVILAALAGYGLSETEALHTVRALRSMVHGFATLELAGGFGLPLDTDESFEWMLEAYLQSLEGVRGDAGDAAHLGRR